MALAKPSIPKGTRDFSPVEMNRRNYIFDTIRNVFKLYGYSPIETPSMENLSTLMGKYGEEGDKLLFKVLNSGDFLKSASDQQLANRELNPLATKICEKGLRYDLTVPFARYVVQHQNEITFPFKRYQIQPVWRADRPQKGRYREFYQCDVDVIGSNSLLNELELIQIIDQVFNQLAVNVTIKLNNRKILAGIAEIIGQPDKIIDITVAIDKLDKIGLDNVNKELIERGIPTEAVEKLQPILHLSGNNSDKLKQLAQVLISSEIGTKGVNEVEKVLNYLQHSPTTCTIELDLTLARGLNYYTGAIFEVKANDVEIGSICGGGRYDDLTGIFGLKDVSGVGVSFGADRIYDVIEQLNAFPEKAMDTTKLLFINFGEKEEQHCVKLANEIRKHGINTEIYPSSEKMKKQMGYADKKNIQFVALIGEQEITTDMISLKNMSTGEQKSITLDELINTIK